MNPALTNTPRRRAIRMTDKEIRAVFEAFLYAEAGTQDGYSQVFTNGGHGMIAFGRVFDRVIDEMRRRGIGAGK